MALSFTSPLYNIKRWHTALNAILDAIKAEVNLKADLSHTHGAGLAEGSPIPLNETTKPGTTTNQGKVYAKDDGGDTELFYQMDSSGKEAQLTQDGLLNEGFQVRPAILWRADTDYPPVSTLVGGAYTYKLQGSATKNFMCGSFRPIITGHDFILKGDAATLVAESGKNAVIQMGYIRVATGGVIPNIVGAWKAGRSYNNAEAVLPTTVGTKSYLALPLSADLTSGGTAIESGHASTYVPANAFDNNGSTYWASSATGAGISGSAWIGYDFGAGTTKKVVAFTITQQSAGQAITSAKLQYSDDGSNWNDTETFTLTADTSKYYKALTTTYGTAAAHRYWRLLANANTASGSWQIFEIEFLDGTGTAGTAHASTEPTWPTTNGYSVLDNNAILWVCQDGFTLVSATIATPSTDKTRFDINNAALKIPSAAVVATTDLFILVLFRDYAHASDTASDIALFDTMRFVPLEV